ncbi:MAG: hypothetical protein AB8G96_00815 [Phycisphaerales bacterium]
MNGMHSEFDARRRELAAGAALDGLDPAEREEFDRLGGPIPGEIESLELTAAELERALHEAEPEPASMPVDVQHRVVAALRAGAAPVAASASVASSSPPVVLATPAPPSRWGTFAGIAAAAGLVLAGVLVLRSIGSGPPAGTPVLPQRALSPVEQARVRLVSRATDLAEMRWQATDHQLVRQARDQGLIGGEVVWSESLGEGFVRVCYLAANDPAAGRYRVWIWPADQPDQSPIPAGTFDVVDTSDFTTVQLELPLNAYVPVRAQVTLEPQHVFEAGWDGEAVGRAVLLEARVVGGRSG